MVTQSVLGIVFRLVDGILSLLPDVEIVVPANIISSAAQFFRIAAYILPLDTVAQVLGIIIALQAFRIIISLIKTIWALLPVV